MVEYLSKEAKTEILARYGPGVAIHIEDLVIAGFPESSVYPRYWSGAGSGARLAMDMDCKVVFSHKLMTVTLTPLEDEERSLQKIRIERKRKQQREAHKARIDSVRELIKTLRNGVSLPVETEDCDD